jgi:hypothetical protein
MEKFDAGLVNSFMDSMSPMIAWSAGHEAPIFGELVAF